MKQTLFSFKSYKTYLKQLSEERGAQAQMAEAAGCERSYFSRIINGDVHLSQDQAHRLTVYWDLDADQTKYFLCLVDYDRAGDATYKNYLKQQIHQMQSKAEEVMKKNERPLLESSAHETLYHTSWIYCAVHFLTSIPEYQTVTSMAQRLNVPKIWVESVLSHLQEMGFVKKEKNHWIYHDGLAHIDKNSPLVIYHHQNWRQKAITDSQSFLSDGVHYTNVQSLSAKDFEKIRSLVHEFIQSCGKISGPSKPEELMCFNIDLFRV